MPVLTSVLTCDWDSLGGCGPVNVKVRASSRGRPGHQTGSDPAGRPLRARFGHRQRSRGPFLLSAPAAVLPRTGALLRPGRPPRTGRTTPDQVRHSAPVAPLRPRRATRDRALHPGREFRLAGVSCTCTVQYGRMYRAGHTTK